MDRERLRLLTSRNLAEGLAEDEFRELRRAWFEACREQPHGSRPAGESPDPRDIDRAFEKASDETHILEAAKQWAATSGGCACSGDEPPEPTPDQLGEAAAMLRKRAAAPALWWLSRRLDSAGTGSPTS